jgi:hypothetical protein
MVVDILSLVVSTCVLNQSCGHWFFNDALNVLISMVFKFQTNITIHAILGNMVDDDMGGYIKRQVISTFNFFSFFSLQKFDFKRCIICCILCWINGSRTCTLCLHSLVVKSMHHGCNIV